MTESCPFLFCTPQKDVNSRIPITQEVEMSIAVLGGEPKSRVAFSAASSRQKAKHYSDTAKRMTDLVIASLALVVAAPVMVLLAVLIAVTSKGGVLYRQERYGKDRKVFCCYKFRTMRTADAASEFVQCVKADARITPVGSFLRRTSLDELPQLFNVLDGSMSIVGPRPHPIKLDDEFAPRISDYDARFGVRPGITGLAQIRGHRGPTPSDAVMKLRVDADLEYIQRRGLSFDLWILVSTIPAVFSGCNAF